MLTAKELLNAHSVWLRIVFPLVNNNNKSERFSIFLKRHVNIVLHIL